MSTILDRLNAQIAAEPALDLATIFVDLQDARDALLAQIAENTDLKDRLSAPPETAPAPAKPTESEAPTVAASSVTEAITLLKDGKGRLAVNALSDVGINMDKAIKALGG